MHVLEVKTKHSFGENKLCNCDIFLATKMVNCNNSPSHQRNRNLFNFKLFSAIYFFSLH